MHKRKYTREQLEFYFKRLMNELKRIPTEEDMERALGYPSVSVYVERFGSWQNSVRMFADINLARHKCAFCKKEFIKTKITQKFCSDRCAKDHAAQKLTRYTKRIDSKVKDILDNKCFVCDFSKITQIHSLDNKKESITKILKAYNKKDMHEFVLLCPNHHEMVHSRLARLHYNGSELVWEE